MTILHSQKSGARDITSGELMTDNGAAYATRGGGRKLLRLQPDGVMAAILKTQLHIRILQKNCG